MAAGWLVLGLTVFAWGCGGEPETKTESTTPQATHDAAAKAMQEQMEKNQRR
jgi:hypothetical protein